MKITNIELMTGEYIRHDDPYLGQCFRTSQGVWYIGSTNGWSVMTQIGSQRFEAAYREAKLNQLADAAGHAL